MEAITRGQAIIRVCLEIEFRIDYLESSEFRFFVTLFCLFLTAARRNFEDRRCFFGGFLRISLEFLFILNNVFRML